MTPARTRNPGMSPGEKLQHDRTRLAQRYMGGDALKFMSANARLLDDYFRLSFETSQAGPVMDLVKNPYAIIALGGYGRMRTMPGIGCGSVVSFSQKIPASADDLIREMIYPLWDMGIEVGHATRVCRRMCHHGGQGF